MFFFLPYLLSLSDIKKYCDLKYLSVTHKKAKPEGQILFTVCAVLGAMTITSTDSQTMN